MVPEPIALVDMDGTLVDYDSAMRRDLDLIAGPNDPPIEPGHPGEDPEWLEARRRLIKSQTGWWKNLPRHQPGFDILTMLREQLWNIHILTKGPWKTTSAWSEKVEWCREHVPFARVHVGEDKGLVYGKVLVDDWPPYIKRWLTWRPRGLVIMPAWPWNEGHFEGSGWRPNVIRYTGSNAQEIRSRLWEVRQTTIYSDQDNNRPECPDFTRVSGDILCPDCGKPYWKHPVDLAAVTGDKWRCVPWLHVACDGRRLKL